jgi:uncharacterized membrane protein SirB2
LARGNDIVHAISPRPELPVDVDQKPASWRHAYWVPVKKIFSLDKFPAGGVPGRNGYDFQPSATSAAACADGLPACVCFDNIMDYQVAKHIHQAAAALTLTLFFVRGVWMLTDSPRLAQRWVRTAPHINDTVLLAAALYMAYQTGWHAWIGAKIGALIVYIGVGMFALHGRQGKSARAVAWLAALAVFSYIVAVAMTKEVLPWQTK